MVATSATRFCTRGHCCVTCSSCDAPPRRWPWRRAGRRGVSRRGDVVTTRRDHRRRPAPDRVNRRFMAAAPNQLWVADMTYVPTWTGFLYLAVVIDVWSRRVVGWSMGERMTAELVLSALNVALTQRKPQAVIHHSDQGSQGGFNRSLQHRVKRQILGTRSALLPASSSPTFCAACY